MNNILRKITNECYDDKNDKFFKKVGNYIVKRNLNLIVHKYYDNTICVVSLNDKKFALYTCGYDNYRLTTAQLNYLEEFYKNKGYTLRFRG